MSGPQQALEQLMAVILERKASPSDRSYTSRLLREGIGAIGRKISEEAAEVVEAAGEPGSDGQAHLVRESADLVYHLLVLLAARDAQLSDVADELQRRSGVSGLDEKASRKGPAERAPS